MSSEYIEWRVIFLEVCFSQKLILVICHVLVVAAVVLYHYQLFPSSRGEDNIKLLKKLFSKMFVKIEY